MPGIMENKLRYVLYENEGAFLAQCLDVDIASVGDSEDEALAALKEALDVKSQEVVSGGVESGHGCDSVDALVGAMPVVVVDPGVQGAGSL